MESPRGDGKLTEIDTYSGVIRGCAVETAPIRSVLRVLSAPRLAWGSATATIAAGGSAATITASGSDRFSMVREEAIRLFDGLQQDEAVPYGARPRLYGGFAFTDMYTDPGAGEPWEGYPGAEFVLPAVQLAVTTDGAWLTAAAVGPDAETAATDRLHRWRDRIQSLPEVGLSAPPGISSHQYNPSRKNWRKQVNETIDRIRGGELQKVVLAQSLTTQLREPVVVPDALAHLGDSYPSCHRFMFHPESGGIFFGATPERLVTVRGDTVDTEALAGSTGRGETPAEDQWLASELEDSEKDIHEHELVVETIRDQLEPLAGEIETGTRTVRRLATVQHLQTPIRATLTADRHVLEFVEALHPTPAVGGLPPQAALDTIQEAEAFDRGWYAAPVGWIDGNGDGTFAVALRSAVTNDQRATLFAGAGIVADSDADRELDEIQLKYRPIRDVLS